MTIMVNLFFSEIVFLDSFSIGKMHAKQARSMNCINQYQQFPVAGSRPLLALCRDY